MWRWSRSLARSVTALKAKRRLVKRRCRRRRIASKPMTTDEDLTKLIEQLLEPAARSFQYEYVAHHEWPKDVPPVWDLAKPLAQAMNAHPEFAEPFSKFFLGKQIAFFNSHQSVNLLRVALRNGAVEALTWYRRVIATECTKMRVVAAVYGLWVQKRHMFSNGVTLSPLLELPDSPNSLSLKQPVYVGLSRCGHVRGRPRPAVPLHSLPCLEPALGEWIEARFSRWSLGS